MKSIALVALCLALPAHAQVFGPEPPPSRVEVEGLDFSWSIEDARGFFVDTDRRTIEVVAEGEAHTFDLDETRTRIQVGGGVAVRVSGRDTGAKVFTNQFDVDLCEDIRKTSPITVRFPKLDTRNSDVKYKTFQPGQPAYGDITFEGIPSRDSFPAISAWVRDTYDAEKIRKDVTIELRDYEPKCPRTFNLIDTLPTSFNFIDVGSGGSSGAVRSWTLEVRVNRIEMA